MFTSDFSPDDWEVSLSTQSQLHSEPASGVRSLEAAQEARERVDLRTARQRDWAANVWAAALHGATGGAWLSPNLFIRPFIHTGWLAQGM